MGVKSEAWNWEEVKEDFWREPSEESHYLSYRWMKDGRKKILDLGCGVGRHSIFFAKKGFEVYAFDLSASGLEELKRLAEIERLDIKTELGDMITLSYESESFDCLIAFHVIYHTDRTGLEAVISEIERVLKAGGEIYITFNSKNNPSFFSPSNIKLDENTVLKTEGVEKGIPHYYVDEKEIRRLMSAFKIITLKQVQFMDETGSSWHYHVLARKAEYI